MQSHVFYTTETQGAIPLILITLNAWKNLDPEICSETERHFLLNQQFSGKCGEVVLSYNQQGNCEKVFIGTGEGNDALAMAQAATRLPPAVYHLGSSLSYMACLQWSLAQYRYDVYKKQITQPRVLSLQQDLMDAVIEEAEAIFLIRNLINQPANILGPQKLAEVVKKLAQDFGAEFKEWIGDELLTDNFPAIHAVGRAADEVPRLLNLNWGDKKNPCIALVGKGVCFDSGGLDIKNSGGMRLMKKDMGGAAQVIGLAQWIMTKKLPIRLEVYIPAVENAVGSRAYRPGDVLIMRNGLTVEVDNTDAEGRLVMADAIALACENEPDILFDFSTLTGAARTAVGTEIAAMFTNDDEVAQDLMVSSQQTGDMLWRMPLYAGYAGMLDSSIADMANSGASPYAGAITAALFLQRFVKPALPWVHFDIMAWNVGNKPGRPEGGEAMAMRAVGDYLMNRFGTCP